MKKFKISNFTVIGAVFIIALILLFFVLRFEDDYEEYTDELFEQEFVEDDFGVIEGADIRFLNAGIIVEDFLLIDGREYRLDNERVNDILIRKESTKNGTKIIYGLKNMGQGRELQFIWRSKIPLTYDHANDFNLKNDFMTNSEILGFFSNSSYKAYMTFADVAASFGGVSLVYDAHTRTLTASSDKIKFMEGEEMVMDPGVSTAQESSNLYIK